MPLGDRIAELFSDRFEDVRLLVPYEDGGALAGLYALGAPITERHDTPEGFASAPGFRAPRSPVSRGSSSPRTRARRPPRGDRRRGPEAARRRGASAAGVRR